MSSPNDSTLRTLTVALLLCLVCSVVVSTAAVKLKPLQVRNQEVDLKRNILIAGGLADRSATAAEVEETFSQITTRVVDLETGNYVDADVLGVDSIENYDQRKASSDPEFSRALDKKEDFASIKRREQYATVYLVESDGQLERIILPVRGYGLWSTMWGFLALEADANTVAGLGFYEHAETPGLGGEIDNRRWQGLWQGKQIYAGEVGSEPALKVIKGNVAAEDKQALYKIDGLAGATLTANGVSYMIRYWLGEGGFAPFLRKIVSGEV